MKNNRNAIRVLVFFSATLFLLLIYLVLNHIRNSLFESIIINLITGCFVSIVIAYIDYRDKLDENINYFLKEIQTYYYRLTRIENYINKNKKNKKVLEGIKSELLLITENAKKKQETLKFYFILNSNSKNKLKKSICDLYEITFGIDLVMLDIYSTFDKKASNEKKQKNEVIIKNFADMIKVEKSVIDEKMLEIKKYGINIYWKCYLEKFSKNI